MVRMHKKQCQPSTLRHAARLSPHGVRAVNSSGTSAWNPIIRVGMPLASGRLTQYGIDSELPLMFSANAFARVDARHCFRGFNLKAAAAIPAHVDCALDSAGFVAAAHFGDYRWDIDAYLDLAAARAWTFYSAMDYCVEPQIATNAATRRLRIEATVARYFQCEHRAARRGLRPPLPVIQGYSAHEYAYCARALALGKGAGMVGVGSVCRRHLHGPDGLLTIVAELDRVLPSDTVLHLFGVKGGALPALAQSGLGHRIASCDSMAYDAGLRHALPVGRTQELRAQAMINWHAREIRRMHTTSRTSCGVPSREPEQLPAVARLLDMASTAVGQAYGDLVGSDDMDYRQAAHLTNYDAVVVRAVLAQHGPEAFAHEEPDNDYGLGLVYDAVRGALMAAGHLDEVTA